MGALTPQPERALTLYQPWAWLVAHGWKTIENRPPGFSHKSFRGDFWIHAGTRSKAMASVLEDEWLGAMVACREILGEAFALPKLDTLAFGSIIGRATITGIIAPRTPAQGLYAREVSNLVFFRRTPPPPVPWHYPDQYGFQVERAVALAQPVACAGHQGFWRVPEDVLGALREAT